MGSNPDIAEQVNAEVVTKRETMTIGEIFSYIKQETAKVNSIFVSLTVKKKKIIFLCTYTGCLF